MLPMPTLAESYLHRLDPFLIEISSNVGVRWYGLSYAAGFVIAWVVLRWMAKRGRTALTVRQTDDLIVAMIIGVLVGGRLGYAIFYDPALFGFTSSFPWWNMLAIQKGGMASHGGMIGVIIACTWFARRKSISGLHLLDVAALLSTAGLCLGRVANFINGELWGRALPASMQADPPWWSIKYAEEIMLPGFARAGEVYDALHGVVGGDESFLPRVVEQAKAGDPAVVGPLMPLLTAYWPSQIFQAITDGPILAGILVAVWAKPRKPGVVGAWFLVVYGCLRVLTEQFRTPDAGVALLLDTFTRGQVLSFLMIAAGLVSVFIVSRRDVPKVGGLLKPSPFEWTR